ncbi:site-specific DNA-methyltransferase [uncultured Desulfuromonas sp.]|uniref:site-specific DNA-methyltransferase n=1 Tax=uncultured Desulfuromonas sp. TaxID=181013 RepID=UPI00261F6827|nr:site-specific DNA-methyltransferase [uncultured Desulfuromonas sp.]
MKDDFRQMVIDALRRGEDLPTEWSRILFPPDKQEYELVYHGKERKEEVIRGTMGVPLQPASSFGKNSADWHNKLIFGDNLQAMKSLLRMKERNELVNADGSPGVKLIYIDPPFATKQEFRGSKEQKAYQDKIAGAQFVEFMRKRLVFLYELLADDGCLYFHLDTKKIHYMKVVLDEIFGEERFVNEVIWKRTSAHSDSSLYANVHDTLLLYSKSSKFTFNQQFTDYTEAYIAERYKHIETKGPRKGERYADDNLIGTGLRGGGYPYDWKGVFRTWRCPIDTMRKYAKENKLYYTRNGVARIKRFVKDLPGVPLSDVWTDVNPVNSQAAERLDYPTQKSESLLERIIKTSSSEGDIVFDAFAGSGTSLAVAEKLGRRWAGIDCGKLSIYSIQKRMLNLKEKIGNKGKCLSPKPFTVYNAGLYDFSTLKQLPWFEWRFFALQLFGCKEEPHSIGGLKLDGKLKGASVLVFNHQENPGQRIDEETIHDIHGAVGKKIGNRFFIVAPRGVFDFQQDYIDCGGVRYYALRIPYSVINELHSREFSALQQPNDETAVNDTVDAVGFDFIQPPLVDWSIDLKKRKGKKLEEACLQIKDFESRARLRGKDTKGGLETFSMLMVDFNYNGAVFDMDETHFAHELEAHEWQTWFKLDRLGENIMVVFLDIYGNEAREVVARKSFSTALAETSKGQAKSKKRS